MILFVSSKLRIEGIVLEMFRLLESVMTGGKGIPQVDDQYVNLRRRLRDLSVIIGPPPPFIETHESLWALWNEVVKGVMPSYQERREFLAKHYTEYYNNQLGNLRPNSFEEELAYRDLVLGDQIGEGGLGVVYKAEHLVLDEPRAVKKLDPLFADESGELRALQRFSREAQILAKLHHPNIVRFFDAGLAADHPFIVTEFLDGMNVQKSVDEEGIWKWPDAWPFIRDITDAVAAAHKANVIHRDLKPTNVMIDNRKATVLDFGAGQWIERKLTTRMTTNVVGTAGYIPNELYENPHLVDPMIDCYSLGVLCHFWITGSLPHAGDARHFLREENIPEEVQEFVLKALAPPQTRFVDGSEMLARLYEIRPEQTR